MEPNAFTVATVAKRHTQRASIGIVTLGYAQVQEGQAREKGGTSRDRRRDGCRLATPGMHRRPQGEPPLPAQCKVSFQQSRVSARYR